jgi:hypothetical protein
MATSSKRYWLSRLIPILFIGLAAVFIVALIANFRPRPLLSADDPPDLTYQKMISAYGGQEALARWSTGQMHYEVEFTFSGIGTWKAQFTEMFQLPGKMRREMKMHFRGKDSHTLMVANIDSCWSRTDNEAAQRQKENPYKDARCMDIVRGFHPQYLLDPAQRLSVQGISPRPDGGRDLILMISADDREPTECRVDIFTGMIREYIGPIRVPLQSNPVTVRYEYTDYRPTRGGPIPHRMIGYRDGNKIIDLRLWMIDLDTPVDPVAFKPSDDGD